MFHVPQRQVSRSRVSLAASAAAAPVGWSCRLGLAARVLEKQVTGAVICSWQSKRKPTLEGPAGPSSATSLNRQLILRPSAEAARAGPGREAYFQQFSPAPHLRLSWFCARVTAEEAKTRKGQFLLQGPYIPAPLRTPGEGSKGQLELEEKIPS